MRKHTDRYGNVVLSRYYYSNCLIEAIRAKAKDKKAHIVTRHIKGSVFPHFLWKYDGDPATYDFGADHDIFTPLWYEGYVRKRRDA